MNYIDAFVAKLLRPEPALGPLPPEPPEITQRPAFERELVVVPPPDLEVATGPPLSLSAAREVIDAAIAGYLAEPAPPHLLLVRAAPGVGKTHRAVRTAEALAMAGKRVLYAGPRHAFFADVLAASQRPGLWWEWLPRQADDPERGKRATCRHAGVVAEWLAKGYDGMSFCSSICGLPYIDAECPWHAQKREAGPIVFGQHAHVLAHPLRFHALIGDESPIGAFLHEWVIPAQYVVPQGMDPAAGLTRLLHALASLSLGTRELAGPALMEQAGGGRAVLDACEGFGAAADALPLVPALAGAEDVARADYFHLPALVGLLRREAEAHVAGLDYPGRVVLAGGRLVLLQRRPVSDELPPHVIWLDATANARLYEVAFGRPAQVVDALPRLQGRVFQVWSRSNGKYHTMTDRAIEQLDAQVRAITGQYERAAIITYQDIAPKVGAGLPALHFYAARGTNAFEACDALIVAGTPMPHPHAVHRTAAMLFAERMAPFDPAWSQQVCAYAYVDPADGQGRAYPVGGFWADPDLQAVLWSLREAELIQAVHRGRPILREVDTWLLSNLPIAELPPTRLLSLRELLAAPAHVAAFKWDAALRAIERLAEEASAQKGYVTPSDLAASLGISRKTARKYLLLLAEGDGWMLSSVREGGRPTVALLRLASKAPTEGALSNYT